MKTASTSTEMALRTLCGDEDIITPDTQSDEKKAAEMGIRGPQNYHIPLMKYSRKDAAIALYRRKFRKFGPHTPAYEIKRFLREAKWNNFFKFCFDRNPYDKVVSHYYWETAKRNIKGRDIIGLIKDGYYNNLKSYDRYSINHLPVVDKIYKYEEIDKSMEDISKRLNLEKNLELPKYKAKSTFRKDKRHYSEILTEEERRIIEIIYAREIKLLNYAY